MESSDSNSVVHVSDLVIDAPGLTSADSQTERRRDTSSENECCRVKAFFETCQESHVSEGGSHSVDGQSSDLQVAEVDTTSHHVKYRPEVEDITNDSVDLYEDLGKMVKEHSSVDKEVTLTQAKVNQDTVSHDLFNDNAMDLSLVEDTSPPGTQKYPSSFGINLKPDSDTGSKVSPSCKHSISVVGKISQSCDCNFLSPVRPTTSKADNCCSSSSPHSLKSARRIVPTSSPLKSPNWHEYLRSPVRSPRVTRLIRQKMKKASGKGEMTSSKREQSLSDSEVEDVNESSRLSALDLYTDVLEDSVQLKYQGEIRKLREQITQYSNKLEEMNISTGNLREQLKLTEEESGKVKAENEVLRMNISRLMKTARQEMRSKHREILNLELRLKNGGNEELLRRVIPYQPYTGKGVVTAVKDDAVRTGNIHSKRWSSDDEHGNLAKRRRMSENVREAALTVMKEVKDAICGREENASNAASKVVIENRGESGVNDKHLSHESCPNFSKRVTLEGLEEGKSVENEKEDRQRRRYAQSSSCENFSKEREMASHDRDRKPHDYPSKSAMEVKQQNHEDERSYEHEKRSRRRYSRSSSCEVSSRERESALHGKDRKSYDYPSKSAREGKKYKYEKRGNYEHEKRDRRRRNSRSSSYEVTSRERELALRDYDSKSYDYPSNSPKGEKRDKHEKEGNYECKESDRRRRRYSKSTSCEHTSLERESASHGKDSKSHEYPSKSEKRDKLEKEVSLENEKSERRRRRYSRSSSCEKSSRERDPASHEKDIKSTGELKRGDSQNDRNREKAKRDNKRRYSRSSSLEKSSRERESKFCEEESDLDDYHSKSAKKDKDEDGKEQNDDYKRRERQRGRRYSRSRSHDKASKERDIESDDESHISDKYSSKSMKKETRDKYGESRSKEYQKREGTEKRDSRSCSLEKTSRDKMPKAHKEGNAEWDSKSQNEEARSDRVKKRERQRERRYSRSNSREKRSKERESVPYDKEIKSHENLEESIRRNKSLNEYHENGADDDEKRERRPRVLGSHDRDSDDYLTSRRSHDHSLKSKKYDGDQFLKTSLEAERKSRSRSHERRKKFQDKDSMSPDLQFETKRKKAKEFEKTERRRERKSFTMDRGKHTSDEKNVRLNDREKESDDKYVGSRGRKKYVNEDYEKKLSSSKGKRWLPDEVCESSKSKGKSDLSELRKKDEYRYKKYGEKQRGRVNCKSVSPKLSSKRHEVRPTDKDSDEMVIRSGDHHLQGDSRQREANKSDGMETKSGKMRRESRSSSRGTSQERSLRKRETHSKRREPRTRIYGSKGKSPDEFSELSDEKENKICGKRLRKKSKSDESKESEEIQEELHQVRDSGGKNKNKRNLRSDTENDEEDFERESRSESYERESEEFELIKSGGIGSRENSESADDVGKAGRKMERLEPDEMETELVDSEISDGKNEKEKDKDKLLRSPLKETLKRKRDDNTFESKSDSVARSPDKVSEVRRNRRKCEHYEHGRKDLEWKDSVSELLLEKKTDEHERHSDSGIGEKLDCDDKRDWEKKTQESKLGSRGNFLCEEICERVEEKVSAVSRSNGDSMKSHEREIESYDVENESHDESSSITEVNFDQDGKTKKLFKRKKLCSPREKPGKETSVSTEEVTGLQEIREQSNDMQVESVPDSEEESAKVEENEISSQSYLQSRKHSSPDTSSSRKEVVDMEEKKGQIAETIRGTSSDEGSADKSQRVGVEIRSDSQSSSDDHANTKIAASEAAKPYSQNENVLIVKEDPMLLNTCNKSTYSSHLNSDLQMSSDTGDDDGKVQMFDELSLTCDVQILVNSDEEHQYLSNKKGQQELLSFPDNFRNDHSTDSCEEQVTEDESICAQKENLFISSTKETDILSHEDGFRTEDFHSGQNTAKKVLDSEAVSAKELSAENRTLNNPSEKNTLENKFKCERKTEDGIICSVSSNDGEMFNASTQERTAIEVTYLTSHETPPQEDGEKLCGNDNGLNAKSLAKEPVQQGDQKVSTTTILQKNRTEDILLDDSCSSKKSDNALTDSSPDQGEVSSQIRNELSVTEHIKTASTLCTPAKGPFTFEQGHTVISCGKPFDKIVGSVPEEETRQNEVEYETIQEDAIDVYMSDSSLMDPFSPDRCRKDLFKDKTVKRKVLTPVKAKKKLSSVVLVSSRGEITSKSRSSKSKRKREDQDDLRKRIDSRFALRERSVSRMRPLSSKRELAKKYLQRAKHVQRRKPEESLSEHSPERKRHSDDIRGLILKHDRIRSASRHKHEEGPGSPNYFSVEHFRERTPDRMERRRSESERNELAAKNRQEDRKQDRRSAASKQRSNRNSGNVIEDENRDRNSSKSSTTGRREKYYDYKREKKLESDCKREKKLESDYKGEKKLESIREKEKEGKHVKEADTSLSDGEIRSDSDENSEDEKCHSKFSKKAQLGTEKTVSSDRDKKRTRKSSRHTSSRRTSRRR